MSFKVGDRVKVYGQVANAYMQVPKGLGGGYLYGKKGTIEIANEGDTEVTVQFDGGDVCEAHPKQCRKLKPKKKNLTEVWVNDYGYECSAFLTEREARDHVMHDVVRKAVRFVEAKDE